MVEEKVFRATSTSYRHRESAAQESGGLPQQ